MVQRKGVLQTLTVNGRIFGFRKKDQNKSYSHLVQHDKQHHTNTPEELPFERLQAFKIKS